MSLMTGTLSTQETSQTPWEPDTSLLDAAREIAPIVREPPANDNSPFARGLETDPVTRALVGEEIGRHDSAAAWTLENPLDWAFFCCRLPDEGAEEIYSRGARASPDAR
jgi:indole-3-acetate monooxygenase